METIIASAIAVLGTLLGSGLTLAFQQRTTDKGHHFARREKLRQERLDAYSAYAGALINYRRCLVHLWFCKHEQPPPENPDAVRIRAYDLRSNAQEALFRVQMLTDDEKLGRNTPSVSRQTRTGLTTATPGFFAERQTLRFNQDYEPPTATRSTPARNDSHATAPTATAVPGRFFESRTSIPAVRRRTSTHSPFCWL